MKTHRGGWRDNATCSTEADAVAYIERMKESTKDTLQRDYKWRYVEGRTLYDLDGRITGSSWVIQCRIPKTRYWEKSE